MSDPIPSSIYKNVVLWLQAAKERRESCQVMLHVNDEGKVVRADRVTRVVKETVSAT